MKALLTFDQVKVLCDSSHFDVDFNEVIALLRADTYETYLSRYVCHAIKKVIADKAGEL
jgi:hypothetical protein